MATSRELEVQTREASVRLQADLDASVVYHPDEPIQWGPSAMKWHCTMEEGEYNKRRGQIDALHVAARQARESEQTELALEQFLYEGE